MSAASSANDADKKSWADYGMTRNDVYEFTLMAEYPEVVQQVIAESSDASPPSRRKVMRAIRVHRGMSNTPGKRALTGQLDRLVGIYGYESVERALVEIQQ